MRLTGADIRMGLLLVLGAATCTGGLWAGIHRAPLEAELMASQKIFYFHAPLGIWTILGTCLASAAAAAYLVTRRPAWDLLCASAMEVSTVTCAVVLITGSIWAEFAWGDWFPWGEPRVTTFLVLFLLGIAYFVLRSSVDEPDQRARYSSVLAVVGSFDALLAYFAIHIWHTNHPRIATVEGGQVKVALDPLMREAFLACIVATLFLFAAVLLARHRLARLAAELERVEHEAAEATR